MMKYWPLALCVSALGAAAMDSNDLKNVSPVTRDWFRSMKSPTGKLCCSEADGHRTHYEMRENRFGYRSTASGIQSLQKPSYGASAALLGMQSSGIGRGLNMRCPQGSGTLCALYHRTRFSDVRYKRSESRSGVCGPTAPDAVLRSSWACLRRREQLRLDRKVWDALAFNGGRDACHCGGNCRANRDACEQRGKGRNRLSMVRHHG